MKDRSFSFHRKIRPENVDEWVEKHKPPCYGAGGSAYECRGKPVVFFWYNSHNMKPRNNGYDWFFCARCLAKDPNGEANSGSERTPKIFLRKPLPKSITLKVEVQ